jgi:hypothetical protein
MYKIIFILISLFSHEWVIGSSKTPRKKIIHRSPSAKSKEKSLEAVSNNSTQSTSADSTSTNVALSVVNSIGDNLLKEKEEKIKDLTEDVFNHSDEFVSVQEKNKLQQEYVETLIRISTTNAELVDLKLKCIHFIIEQITNAKLDKEIKNYFNEKDEQKKQKKYQAIIDGLINNDIYQFLMIDKNSSISSALRNILVNNNKLTAFGEAIIAHLFDRILLYTGYTQYKDFASEQSRNDKLKAIENDIKDLFKDGDMLFNDFLISNNYDLINAAVKEILQSEGKEMNKFSQEFIYKFICLSFYLPKTSNIGAKNISTILIKDITNLIKGKNKIFTDIFNYNKSFQDKFTIDISYIDLFEQLISIKLLNNLIVSDNNDIIQICNNDPKTLLQKIIVFYIKGLKKNIYNSAEFPFSHTSIGDKLNIINPFATHIFLLTKVASENNRDYNMFNIKNELKEAILPLLFARAVSLLFVVRLLSPDIHAELKQFMKSPAKIKEKMKASQQTFLPIKWMTTPEGIKKKFQNKEQQLVVKTVKKQLDAIAIGFSGKGLVNKTESLLNYCCDIMETNSFVMSTGNKELQSFYKKIFEDLQNALRQLKDELIEHIKKLA